FFIIETLRTALRGSQSTGDTKPVTGRANDALPEGIQAVITWRLGQLSAEARTLLELAAVIGRSFTFPVLAAALELDEDLAVRALDELWQRQIVREQGPVAYDFSHGYLRSVAYGLLSAARKRLLHRRVAG